MDSTIVIGAGAAGLMAARRLSAAGHPVTLLEAHPSAGGRIRSVPAGDRGFSLSSEGGAEFIHGDLPVSLRLAEEAGISLQRVAAEMVQMRQGKEPDPEHRKALSADWARLMQRMASLDKDRPLSDFLAEWFPGDRYLDLRNSAGRMAEGYDLADLHRVSTHSLYREWAEDSGDEEYRPKGGYERMIGHLTSVCRSQGCRFHFSNPVTAVHWQRGRVEVHTTGGQVFLASRLITTVSLGVLKTGSIEFFPELPLHRGAIARLGFGSVIKVLLEFRELFWRDRKKPGRTLFILSDEQAPTWWTQSGDECPILTGWIAGGPMQAFRRLRSAEKVDTCLNSLAHLFSRDLFELRNALNHSAILDWGEMPYVRGGYSFETVGGEADRAILADPVGETLYFAGEAVYEGPVPGTVEAALSSGERVAGKICR